MRVAILSRTSSGYYAQDLARAAAALGHEAVVFEWESLHARIGGDGGGVFCGETALGAFDAVLLRTMPAGSLEQVIFRMDLLGRLHAAGVRVVNPPRAIEVSVDKYLACALMAEAGLPVVETRVCQGAGEALRSFEVMGRDVVIKPLFGSEGFGITRVTDRALASRAFALVERTGSVLYLQKYVEAATDLRLMVLGDRVLGAIARTGEGWPRNVARGGRAEAVAAQPHLEELAISAARACGCEVAGVDVLIDRAGRPWVLEVNAVPGWRAFAAATGIDVAEALVGYVASEGAKVAT